LAFETADKLGQCRKASDPNCVFGNAGPDGASYGSQVRINELISFKGAQYLKSVILYAVYFYDRFPVSYRDLEEIMAERGGNLDHATLNRWVEKYSSAIAVEAQRRKAPTGSSWRMDGTYVKVKGKWTISTGQLRRSLSGFASQTLPGSGENPRFYAV